LRDGRGIEPKCFATIASAFRRVEPPAHDQQRVVGLVPGPVERLQPVDRHQLDVGARADDRVAVVVPAECKPLHAGEEHAPRVVLAHLELVAHHGHFAVEVALGDARADQPVCFEADRPVQVRVARRKRLEVCGAVVRRRAVVARAAAHELLLDVLELVRILEQQVLEQVRHSLLAVAFMARPDQHGQVDGHRIDARIGHGEHAQAVRQPIFGDTLDGCDRLQRCAWASAAASASRGTKNSQGIRFMPEA
jgi:hypothetical protein